MSNTAAPSDPQDSQTIPRVAILGAGSLGTAILSGLRSPGVRVDGPIAVTTHSTASAEKFRGDDDVIAYAQEADPEANRKAVRGARIVVVTLKPWLVIDVLRDIADDLEPGAIIASAAAGITTESMEAALPATVGVARSMSNTPANVGKAVTGVAGGARATDEQIDLVRRVFETVGAVLVTREDMINPIGAMGGSGPAFFFYFVEQFIAATERLGFSPEDAKTLAQNTLVGAAALLEQSGETAEELRKKVTSPKGTTEQSLRVLESGNWGELFDRTLEASMRRARQLAGDEPED